MLKKGKDCRVGMALPCAALKQQSFNLSARIGRSTPRSTPAHRRSPWLWRRQLGVQVKVQTKAPTEREAAGSHSHRRKARRSREDPARWREILEHTAGRPRVGEAAPPSSTHLATRSAPGLWTWWLGRAFRRRNPTSRNYHHFLRGGRDFSSAVTWVRLSFLR